MIDDRKMPGATESYGEFMNRVDRILIDKVGVGHEDMADCNWFRLYEDNYDNHGSEFKGLVLEEVSEWNDGLDEFLDEDEDGDLD